MQNITTTSNDSEPTILTSLRGLLPNRKLRLTEALRVAELQADRLLRLLDIGELPVPVGIVADLPRVTIETDPDLPVRAASGSSHWEQHRRTWVISVNAEEPSTRQRFTVLHEFKHIVDHYHPGLAGSIHRTFYGLDPIEYVAEYFAGCVLMPKRWVKAAFFDGIQRVSDLAELFEVSPRAMQVRLSQLGITRASDEPMTTPPRYRLQRQSRSGPAVIRNQRELPASLAKEVAA